MYLLLLSSTATSKPSTQITPTWTNLYFRQVLIFSQSLIFNPAIRLTKMNSTFTVISTFQKRQQSELTPLPQMHWPTFHQHLHLIGQVTLRYICIETLSMKYSIILRPTDPFLQSNERSHRTNIKLYANQMLLKQTVNLCTIKIRYLPHLYQRPKYTLLCLRKKSPCLLQSCIRTNLLKY